MYTRCESVRRKTWSRATHRQLVYGVGSSVGAVAQATRRIDYLSCRLLGSYVCSNGRTRTLDLASSTMTKAPACKRGSSWPIAATTTVSK